MKILTLIFLLISTFTLAQEYQYDAGYRVKLNKQDSTFSADSVFSNCGKFVLQDKEEANFAINIRHYQDNKKTKIYIVDEKEYDVKNSITYYKGFDIVDESKKVIIAFDLKNTTISVSNFVDETFYIYIYILKPIQSYDH